jgi:hypothetical protein
MTLRVSARGVQTSMEKMSSVVYRREPPYDPKTLWLRLDQRREIDAWIRSREVKEALPQQASVLELGRTYNALFLHKIEASIKISCTF